MQISKRAQQALKNYERYHVNAINKGIHYLCVPVITVTTLSLLSQIRFVVTPSTALDLGLVLWALSSLWYLRMDIKLGTLSTLVCLCVYYFGLLIPVSSALIAWVLAWVLQFIGHYYYEKNSPALFDNLLQTLVAPFWIVARLARAL